MNLVYTLEIQDMVAFQRYTLERRVGFKKQRFVSAALSLLAFSLIGMSQIDEASGLGAMLHWVLIGVAVAVVVFFKSGRLSAKRVHQYFGGEADRNLFGVHELELDDEGLKICKRYSRSFFAFPAIVDLVETADHTFVFVGSQSAVTIPREGVTEGDYGAFMGALKAAWEAGRTTSDAPHSA